MRPARDDAYTALQTALSALSWAGRPLTVTRKFQPIDQFNVAAMPAIIISLGDEHNQSRSPAQPSIRTQRPDLFIYAKAPRPEDGGALIHGLVDLVEAALLPSPGRQAQTLGGKVAAVQLESAVGYWEDPGATGLVLATFPVSITMP